MKRFFVLLFIVGLIFASDFIQFDKVENLAQRFVNEQFGFHYLDEVITYYGIDELPGAYAMIFRNRENEPLTIVMGAKYTTTPINEISKALPRSQTVFDKVLQKARTLADCEPEFQKIYYFGPGEEYCAFNIGDRDILINACTFKTIEKSFLLRNKPEPNQELELLTRQKWNKYLTTPNFSTRQDSGYIPGVPFIDWTYGCSPTAASMLLWYWDSHGYGRLVDYFFTRWEMVYEEWKDGANVNRELSIAMYTDSTNGGTYSSNMGPGMITVANSINGYSCNSSNSPTGGSWNNWCFSWIKTEIDAGRPCIWGIWDYWSSAHSDYINHALTGVGYQIILPDTFVQVHTTWGWSGEPLWALWTYVGGVYSTDQIITFIPGGSNSNNLFLTYPQQGGAMFKNLKYYLYWESVGSDIDHVKIWYSIGRQASSYDSSYWTVIEPSAPNTGKYLWTVPDQDSAFRINIAGLNSSNQRLAADGSFDRIQCLFPDHSSNLNLVGHFNAVTTANDVVIIGDYAYIANGTDGLMVTDISDSSLPHEVFHLSLPGNNVAMDVVGSHIFLADQEDTLRVISITNPTNPSQVGKIGFNVDQPKSLFAVDTLVYVACRGTGIEIVNVVNPASPSVICSYDTPGQAYDILVSDTFAYVADGTKGIRVLNIADPTDPEEIGFYDTNGITQGMDLQGNYLYLAEGGAGIKVFDVTDPTNPQQLGSFNTSGIAKKVLIADSLFVCDGSAGLRVFDISTPSNPVEVEYLESFGTATNLAHVGSMLYLADGSDGVYVIAHTLTNVSEVAAFEVARVMLECPSIVNMSRGLGFTLNLVGDSPITINIYESTGRLVDVIYDGVLLRGAHDFCYTKELSSGVYFLSIKSSDAYICRKILVIK